MDLTLDDKLLAEAVRRIVAVGDPERVILFGSQARGTASPRSDVDLLILEASDLPRYRRSPRYYEALGGLVPNVEIVVWTPSEAADWAAVPNAFVTTALREGRELYARR